MNELMNFPVQPSQYSRKTPSNVEAFVVASTAIAGNKTYFRVQFISYFYSQELVYH